MDILKFDDCSYKNKHLVGGKCASLGELTRLSQELNFNTAGGFAISTILYDKFIEQNNLSEIINNTLDEINYDDIESLKIYSKKLINSILSGNFTDEQEENIKEHYNSLCKKYHKDIIEVAIRSSAICEDSHNFSSAGQQDTYLNIVGTNNVIKYIKKCFASLFNVRALSYRKTYDVNINEVKISVAVQKMVRSDIGSAGVAFSLDPVTGYNKAIVINSSFGLGEIVVGGGVKPDEIICDKETLKIVGKDPIIMKKIGEKNKKIVFNYKSNNDNDKITDGTIEVETSLIEKLNFSLTNSQAINLGRCVLFLEEKYCEIFNEKIGIDVEWGIDGIDKNLYILQARPETVHSNNKQHEMEKYILDEKSTILISGIAVGEKISTGKIKLLKSLDEHSKFNKGDILVTKITTPDWEPLMKIAGGIITDTGGNTSHAAIVAREMGLNAIVGTSNATEILKEGEICTMNCSEGETGHVHEGELNFHVDKIQLTGNKLPIKLMMNIGNPEMAFTSSMLPNDGVGLVRMEFIINNYIQIHPKALLDYPNLPKDIREKVYNKLGDHDNGEWYFIKRLARGLSQIASAFKPNDVVVRLSDFKSNEYKNLLGGEIYEPDEENSLIGWRGCSRYYSDEYKDAFALECKAIKYAREVMNMKNMIVMLPFCRSPEECKKVLGVMESYGLKRGEDGLKVYIMCEIPSNVIEADNFAPLIDGVSIGGNDLLMLTLGIDRDSEKVAHLSDHTNISYRRMISKAIKDYKEHDVKVSFCGEAPSSSLEFCQFLIDEGINSVSVVPSSVIKTINNLAK